METLPLLIELGVATAMTIYTIVSIFLTSRLYSAKPVRKALEVPPVYRSSTVGMPRKHSCKPGVGTPTAFKY